MRSIVDRGGKIVREVTTTEEVDRAELVAFRARLAARLAAVDAELAQIDAIESARSAKTS